MGIESWSTTASNNNSAPPDGWPEGQAPSSVNDCGRQMMAALRTWYEDAQWVNLGHTPTRIDADTFTVAGDLTAIYHAGRRLKLTGGSTGYASIASSSYSAPDTTVNVTMDSGSLPNPLSAVYLSVLSADNPAVPASYINDTAAQLLAKLITVDGSGSGLDADTVDGSHASAFAAASHTHANGDLTGYTAADVLSKLLTVDGAGSGLDADLLDGANLDPSATANSVVKRTADGYIEAVYFRQTSNENDNPTVNQIMVTPGGSDDHLYKANVAHVASAIVSAGGIWTSANDGAGSGLDADTVDGNHASAFAAASHAHAASDITSGTFADARIAQSNVTQHQAALGSESAAVSTIARRDASGYLFATYLNQSSADSENPTVGQFIVRNNSADGYNRAASVAHAKRAVVLSCTIQSDPGGTPSGSPGDLFLYY